MLHNSYLLLPCFLFFLVSLLVILLSELIPFLYPKPLQDLHFIELALLSIALKSLRAVILSTVVSLTLIPLAQ